jgi:transposase InsO family protein
MLTDWHAANHDFTGLRDGGDRRFCIALFTYNPKRRHSFSNDMSPAEYEKQYFKRLSSV